MRKRKYFILRQARRSKRARIVTTIVLSMVVFMAAVLAYGRIVEVYANRMVGEALVNLINHQSADQFTVTYDSIGVKAFSNKVTVKNFKIVDNRNIVDISGKRINATIPMLHLDVDGILFVWINDYLNVNNISISQPQIDIINYSKEEKVRFTTETGSFFKTLQAQLNLLEIDHLIIKQAKINYYRQSAEERTLLMQVADLSLELDNFEWDVDDSNLEDLESEGLRLEIKHQELMLPDSSYKLHFDDLLFSLRSDELILKNLTLSDVDHLDSNKEGQKPVSLSLPELRISGIDYSSAFDENIIAIEAIRLIEPNLALLSKRTNLQSNKSSDKSLSKVITSVFNEILIDTIKMENGQGDVSLSNKGSHQQFYSDHLDLTITKLKLDTTQMQTDEGYLSYQAITFSAENYSSILKDSLSRLSIKKIYYSTDEQAIRADSLSIEALDSLSSTNNVHTNLSIPQLSITGFNEELLSSEGELVIDEFHLTGMSVDVKLGKQKAEAQSKSIDEILKEVFKDKITSINIEDIRLNKLNIKAFTDDKVSLQIKNGTVHTQSFQWAEEYPISKNLHSLTVNLSEVDIKIPDKNITTNLKDSKIDFLNNQIEVKSASISQNNLDIDGKNMKMKLGDWTVKSYLDSLHIVYLGFEDYSIDWVQPRSTDRANNSLISQILIDSLNLANGSINLKMSGGGVTSARIPNIKASSMILGEQVLSEELVCQIADFEYKDSKNAFVVEHIDFNKQTGQLNISGANISTDITNDSLRIRIPIIRMSKINTDLLLNDHSLKFDELKFSNWQANIYYGTNQHLEKSDTGSNEMSLGKLKEVKFNKLILEKGKVVQNNNPLRPSEVELEFQDIHIDSSFSRLDDPSNILFAKRLKGQIQDLFYANKDLEIGIEKLKFLKENTLSIQKFSVTEKTKLVDIDSVYLKNLAINNLIKSNTLKAELIAIYQPNIVLDLAEKDEEKSNNKMQIDVDQLSVHSAVVDIKSSGKQRIQLDPVDMELRGFRMDSTTDMTKTLIPAESMSLTTRDLKFATADGLSEILVGSVNLSSDIHGFKIKDIRINPLYDRKEHMRRKGYETDWIEGSIEEVELDDLDYFQLLNNKALVSKYLKVTRPRLVVYRNKNLKDSLPDYRPLPATLLKNFGSTVSIDSVQITNASITYEEVGEKGEEPGKINFDSLHTIIYNITNVPLEIQLNSKMRADVATNVNGVPFEGNFRFFLDRNDDKFEMSGELDANDMTRFNVMTEHAAFVKVESGRCRKLYFSAVANNDLAYGSMYFHYSNLKVALVDKKTANTKKIEESVASFFANTFIIKKNNLSLVRLRKGDIYFRRNKQKAIFNYLSKLFLSGVSSSVGLKNYNKEIRKMKEEGEIGI